MMRQTHQTSIRSTSNVEVLVIFRRGVMICGMASLYLIVVQTVQLCYTSD